MSASRPHVLGIDDGPFDKGQDARVPIVGVLMEAADLVEAAAVTWFPPDGDRVTDFLAEWVGGLRLRDALQGVVLGGITIAGLAVIEIERLAQALSVPVLSVTRRDPTDHRLDAALRAASLHDRLPLVERSPPAFRASEGLWVAHAGVSRDAAARLVRATLRKSRMPEPLRLAHLFGRALVRGESRGRV